MITETPDEPELRHGSRIGRFVIVGELGSGGMGIVYAAHDRELDRRVALKVLRGAAATDEERIRMLREGQAMARVTHPNVITVYEVGVEGSLVFLAQELLDGGTLGQWLAKGHTASEILDTFVAAGRGLAAAHAAGLVHRDFKPDNVLLGKDGRVRVADFGLARALGAVSEALAVTTPGKRGRSELDEPSPMNQLTRTGTVMGTPMFMAPEQHNGERADERSDQFSFCVALYHALYEDWPFAGKTAVSLADAVIHGRIQPPPRRSRVPARLRRILLRGLSLKPSDRYPSIDALLAELTTAPARPFRKLMLVAGMLVVVGGAVVGGYVLRSRAPEAPLRTAAPRPPVPPPDVKSLTTGRGIEWLSAAMERGQLDDAVEKYDMAAALKVQAGARSEASIARSAAAVVLVMRGHLDQARARLREADADKGQDPVALAYANLAAAMIASASGDLAQALDLSERCARQLSVAVPVLAAMCLQLQGATAADIGDRPGARRLYADGLVLAKNLSPQRTMSLDLALAELDLDDAQVERAAATATKLQAIAAARDAVSPEAQAWVALARARLAQTNNQKANEVLEHVKPETLQSFRIRIEHQIASGQAMALLGDPDGLERIRAARREAQSEGFAGLGLEARLALVEVLTATTDPTADTEQRALVKDARALGYGRVVELAETVQQR